MLISRTGYTGEDGYEIFVQTPEAGVVWDTALEVGTPMGMVPAGLAARNTLRLEAGMPLYGNELSEDIQPAQAGLGWAVTIDPDSPREFVGADTLEASREAVTAWRGYPVTAPDEARLLVGLVGEGRRAARDDCVVYSSRGDQVGRVTSGVLSPSLGRPIAMAYVHPEFAADDTSLVVDVRGRELPMTTVRLPFYRRSQ